MSNCCAANSPSPGPFPPARPRLRQRHYQRVLKESALLHATQTLDRRSPRMVKRRKLALQVARQDLDRTAQTRVPIDSTAQVAAPMQPPQPRTTGNTLEPWSPSNPDSRLYNKLTVLRPDKHLAREAGLRSRAYRLDCDSTDGAHEGGRHGTVCGD